VSVVQDLRTRARHRGLTPWQLIQKIGRLEREADEATCRMVAMATEIDELQAERDQLEADFDQAAIDLSGTREDLGAAEEEIADLRQRLAPFLAAEANATRITVPPMVRDTSDPADQATGPIYVRPLWDAADAGLLGPVTDPAGVHGEGVA